MGEYLIGESRSRDSEGRAETGLAADKLALEEEESGIGEQAHLERVFRRARVQNFG